ncbi:hypothetical protein U8527_07560 [Kordia algicida OT-1]|uniref:GIY-YIG domain-containing protein n=1 Tax=Kordia algicida OT-1 TaxID=391587 RepID=A9E892_9FLAO|nr:hypothetical protein [Kordia algicida]EDP94760.1 hypothetical protein KAOT1_01000 [Kordia algicida OT-1]
MQNPYIFNLRLKNRKIESWTEFKSGKILATLSSPLTGSDYKIYVITWQKNIVYIGTTRDRIKNRLNSGLKGSPKKGYHGYKWKDQEEIRVFIWNFPALNKEQTENIEAELAYIVRKKTGKWPKFQNEIHFNNKYEQKGKHMAENIYETVMDNLNLT